MAAPATSKRKKPLPSGIAAALAASQQPAAKQGDLKAFIDAARNAQLMRRMSREFI